MSQELLTFIAFVCLQGSFHAAAELSHNHWLGKLVKFQAVAVVAHPTVLHAIQDYAIHVVVYSGMIIHH
jgi:hypothetical protein